MISWIERNTAGVLVQKSVIWSSYNYAARAGILSSAHQGWLILQKISTVRVSQSAKDLAWAVPNVWSVT